MLTESNRFKKWSPVKYTKVAVIAVSLASLAACGSTPSACGEGGSGNPREAKVLLQAASACPKDQVTATYLGLDLSNTARSEAIRTARVSDIRLVAETTALCEGQLKVVGFTSSQAASSTLFDADVTPKGSTIEGRARKVKGIVDAAMEEICVAQTAAEKNLPGEGSDPLGQIGMMAQYFAQAPPESKHIGFVLTDGLQTEGVLLNTGELTAPVASELAAAVPVAPLPGADLTFAGIGIAEGFPPPTEFVEALTAFYSAICAKSEAKCLVVTDLVR
jgi:hypothetical protein